MSRTTTITIGERGFWALDDAFGVWLAYLVEQIDRQGTAADSWLAQLAAQWRVAAAVTDFGSDAGELTSERSGLLCTIAVDRLRRWIIVDDLPVADGFSRTGDRVEVDRVLEVADGFIALLDGTLAPDPPTGAWLLGTGNGPQVLEYRQEARAHPRFQRRG